MQVLEAKQNRADVQVELICVNSTMTFVQKKRKTIVHTLITCCSTNSEFNYQSADRSSHLYFLLWGILATATMLIVGVACSAF